MAGAFDVMKKPKTEKPGVWGRNIGRLKKDSGELSAAIITKDHSWSPAMALFDRQATYNFLLVISTTSEKTLLGLGLCMRLPVTLICPSIRLRQLKLQTIYDFPFICKRITLKGIMKIIIS